MDHDDYLLKVGHGHWTLVPKFMGMVQYTNTMYGAPMLCVTAFGNRSWGVRAHVLYLDSVHNLRSSTNPIEITHIEGTPLVQAKAAST